ncbi:LLM class flavin-dependent oxidoreductase [Streptomyces ipomoeae]|jgi:alkanesulfonate monooxygenase SsuD/methylene tetrahydromethanopterin reductase-like flavin-dependent oxidoreductase (luciferase family)|uniref:Luciferase-like monooxygenase n=2 Tax=Streptomyces ipomoeae TaxID=103232 RepID=L1L441_9ACTN|nr:LLM class flavin-dependent oxidoreductase [Streptomyces ipomoeae]EKX67480.1 luciferase-like monooxygenase [Streptomyces ipomoeae 91-03]MDX2693764.1 LLM class flavin-dependent oxidoreductase [Streptomyces ipomoeae]MDX2819526.1 LLM class flavin-dependent oxidoreductase [Streptomyces ipomoeae]MDX2840792.1 LLM class flavin-dependent oxidoreductase [Streptomyces ipomoeae]MDX2875081.1 LLM class flavin-dependent oxidoreductase [Streptomyces ipomoeae]
MKFGLFYSHQLPRPWAEDSERRLMDETLEQIELADRLGYDAVWCSEHHFLEEYSHLSAPELFLAAVSRRTSRIRIGQGIATLPPAFNPTARVAERAATLDLLSGGRYDFGTGESTTLMELAGFGIDPATKRAQWAEALDAVTRMFVEEPFAGYDGTYVSMPTRNVLPKPVQKPHPPLWMACGSREAILTAGRKGLGALNFAFAEPAETRKWVDAYYATIASEECVPAGFAVNPQVAAVIPMMCHPDEATAVERAADGVQFFTYGLGHYIAFGDHAPGRTRLWEEFQRDRRKYGMGRAAMGGLGGDLGNPARGAIGTPDQIRRFLRLHEEAGLDQAILIVQGGGMEHEHICESLELFAREVMPEFRERDEQARAQRLERLQPAIDAALARREPPRKADPDYRVKSRKPV